MNKTHKYTVKIQVLQQVIEDSLLPGYLHSYVQAWFLFNVDFVDLDFDHCDLYYFRNIL